jgi:glutamate 5-kinase
VVEVHGGFERGDVVACIDSAGNEIARGIVNYNSHETSRIMRKASSEIGKILGYVEESELIHRDNLVVI